MTMQASILLPDELFNELKRRAPQLEEKSSLIAEALSFFLQPIKMS